jgi:ATP-dependent DNA helicase RecG
MVLNKDQVVEKLRLGEDGITQFKMKVDSQSLAEEMVAFANGSGGYIFIGVKENDKGVEIPIGVENTKELNNLISNASTENCVPPIFPKMQNIFLEEKTIVILYIEAGLQKPYRTKAGKYILRAGADKRAVSQEELSRMMQESNMFHIEELAIRDALVDSSINMVRIDDYFKNIYKESVFDYIKNSDLSFIILCQNIGIAKGNELNLVGLLLFANNPQIFRPSFFIKAVNFFGNEIEEIEYRSSEDIHGVLLNQYERGMNFITSHLMKKQNGQSFNSVGVLEISEIALQEFLVNALVHRDYSRLGSIKILMFANRIEIISPGHLVNHLSIENIKNGNAIPRNPILLSLASKILPYRGLGSGIRRALKEHPHSELINDKEGQQFKVVLWRPE